MAGAEVTSAFSKLPESNNLPVNGNPGPGSPACPGSPEDVFCDFLYWRTPLPDISQDLELLLSGTGPQEAGCCLPETVHSSCVARSEIQKVLDSLQEHMMNDPDVQGQCHPPGKGMSGCARACVLLHLCVSSPLVTLHTSHQSQNLSISLQVPQGSCLLACGWAGPTSALTGVEGSRRIWRGLVSSGPCHILC